MKKVKQILNKEITSKDILFGALILSLVAIICSINIFGTEATSKMTQSFGIGLGGLLGGLAGLTAFLDWLDKEKRAEKYIKELKNKYPKKLLAEGKLKIVQRADTDMVYLLDKRNDNLTRRWFQDQEARKDLGFSSFDTSETMSNEELNKYIEDDPIVAKKKFY